MKHFILFLFFIPLAAVIADDSGLPNTSFNNLSEEDFYVKIPNSNFTSYIDQEIMEYDLFLDLPYTYCVFTNESINYQYIEYEYTDFTIGYISNNNLVRSINFKSDLIQTSRGISIGSSIRSLEEMYGIPYGKFYDNDITIYMYTFSSHSGPIHLFFKIQDFIVVDIIFNRPNP